MTQISPDIGFLTSYIRGQYAKLFSKEEFENLINKPYEIFISDLMSFEIGEKLRKHPAYKSHEIERLLTESLLDRYSFILKHSPIWAKEFFEAYTIKFEGMNLQRIARYLYSKTKVDLKEVINLRPQEMLGRTAFISKMLQSENLANFIDLLKETEYKSEIEIGEQLFSKTSDIWPIEFALESFYLKQMLEKIPKLKKSYRAGASSFVSYEVFRNLLLIVLKADFVEIDVEEALRLLPFPEDFPFKKNIMKMIDSHSLSKDLEILKSFASEKIFNGIKRYEEDKMFLHIEIAIKASEIEILEKSFHQDFGILSILCYLRQYETQIQDLNRLLYLKEYKFPIEKTRELIINLV